MAGNTVQIHKTGSEYILKVAMTGEVTRVTSVTMGLFNDSIDNLNHDSDMSDITTEPNDGNYSAQSINLDTDSSSAVDNGFWKVQFSPVDFDIADTTGDVDSYYFSITYQSEGDTLATEHLLFTGSLDQTYSLSELNVFNIDENTIALRMRPFNC